MVAVVIGSLMPSLVSSGPELAGNIVTLSVEAPLSPAGCFMTSCGKGAPTTPASGLASAGLAATFAAGIALVLSVTRRRRAPVAAASLPRGWDLALFHPPRDS